jgi:methyltransferase-like protein 6
MSGKVDDILERQGDGSKLSEIRKSQLEKDAKKNWDKFYMRNSTNFFKDRHWTTREFTELTGSFNSRNSKRVLLEVGCGVGNFALPLLQEQEDLFIYACDFSPRAINFVKADPRYDEKRAHAFVADIISDKLIDTVIEGVDIASLIFVLSAVHPDKFVEALHNIFDVLKPGGIFIFRDYGLHDMAQLRFKAHNKLGENFYVRQDGTRSYYFTTDQMNELLLECGFEVIDCEYVHRSTVNVKENVNVPRIFVQAKARRPE